MGGSRDLPVRPRTSHSILLRNLASHTRGRTDKKNSRQPFYDVLSLYSAVCARTHVPEAVQQTTRPGKAVSPPSQSEGSFLCPCPRSCQTWDFISLHLRRKRATTFEILHKLSFLYFFLKLLNKPVLKIRKKRSKASNLSATVFSLVGIHQKKVTKDHLIKVTSARHPF